MNSEKELMFTITALRNLNVKTICELGAGDCRWAIRMAAELGGEVDAVENLAWKQWEHTYTDELYKKINTVDDIVNICKCHNVNFIYEDVMNFKFNKNYDAVRIDCLDSEHQLEILLNRALQNTDVIIIDDISPYQVISRTSVMLTFLQQNKLKLYLITNKIAVLTKLHIIHPPLDKPITVIEDGKEKIFKAEHIYPFLKHDLVKVPDYRTSEGMYWKF